MECHACGVETVTYPVPEQYRSHLPEEGTVAATCPQCLTLWVDENGSVGQPSFQRISDAFPSASDAAVPMAIALGLLSSLALNRQSITDLLAAVERAGTDPMLVIGRLIDDSGVDSDIDLAGRRRQIEQLR